MNVHLGKMTNSITEVNCIFPMYLSKSMKIKMQGHLGPVFALGMFLAELRFLSVQVQDGTDTTYLGIYRAAPSSFMPGCHFSYL